MDREVLIRLLLIDKAEKDSLLAEADLLISKQDSLILQMDSVARIQAQRIENLKASSNVIANLLSVSNTANEILQEAYAKSNTRVLALEDDIKKLDKKITTKNKITKVLGITSGISVPLLIYIVINALK